MHRSDQLTFSPCQLKSSAALCYSVACWNRPSPWGWARAHALVTLRGALLCSQNTLAHCVIISCKLSPLTLVNEMTWIWLRIWPLFATHRYSNPHQPFNFSPFVYFEIHSCLCIWVSPFPVCQFCSVYFTQFCVVSASLGYLRLLRAKPHAAWTKTSRRLKTNPIFFGPVSCTDAYDGSHMYSHVFSSNGIL